MSKKNAEHIGLEILPTSMRIRPYGSKAKKCLGESYTTIMHGTNVANAKFYIMGKEVETLISGPVCEELGIITMNDGGQTNILRTSQSSEAKEKLLKRFPSIFSGVGTLKNYKVKFFVDENIPPVYQPARPIPFHIREKLDRELQWMEEDDVIEPHSGPAPWVSNTVLSPKDDGGVRLTVDMRCANKAILKTNLPIPRLEEIGSQLAGYTVFTKLDFRS